MPEYRRFIAYFYEYIDGRKQRNAGFAKVELRGGMWRLLFRLTAGDDLELPVKIYGFVREEGYLLGLPMGAMYTGQEAAQEWAYRADVPIKEKYLVEDLSGIWIQSSDDRIFLTVWDEDEIDPGKFVLELPGKAREDEDAIGENVQEPENMELEEPEPETAGENASWTGNEEPEAVETELSEPDLYEEETAEPEKEETEEIEAEEIEAEETENQAEESRVPEQEAAIEKAETAESGTVKSGDNGDIQELFRSRPRCQPFRDGEITGCVMLRPCDIVWLQQRGWQVGRSSFLQHGFYQYRHLLLGTTEDGGTIVLGVPGVYNPQEKYMAGMFGFEDFKESGEGRNNNRFGYWCRKLERRI